MNVVDGTKCDRYTDDICVYGKCKVRLLNNFNIENVKSNFRFQKAGCDNVLGSDKKYDNCNVCGGNNSTCRLVRNQVSVPMIYGKELVFCSLVINKFLYF